MPWPRRRDSLAATNVIARIHASAPATPAWAKSQASTAPIATSCTKARTAATTISREMPSRCHDAMATATRRAGPRPRRRPARDLGHGCSGDRLWVRARRARAGGALCRGPAGRRVVHVPVVGGLMSSCSRSRRSRGPARGDPSLVQHPDVVGDAVRPARRRGSRGRRRGPDADERPDHGVDRVGAARVERRRGLVEQQHLRADGERPGEAEPLQLAAGQAGRRRPRNSTGRAPRASSRTADLGVGELRRGDSHLRRRRRR